MNRRNFVSRVTLGAAAACTGFGRSAHATPIRAGLSVRFIGMMAFIERADRSYLAATPGHHSSRHMTHTPFLMARKGTSIAAAFDMKPARGVVPAAFDTMLLASNPSDFVYRSLDNTALDVVSGGETAVTNAADQMAKLHRIAPKKRVRGNIEKWASATISLRGGRIENSAGHPDAGKIWAFGNYKQQLTDAVNYRSAADGVTTMRLTSGTDAKSFVSRPGEVAELWVISAAQPGEGIGEPTALEHSEVLFDYLVDATPIVATCPDATGRIAPPTELPFVHGTSAALGAAAGGSAVPPWIEFCYIADILLGGSGS